MQYGESLSKIIVGQKAQVKQGEAPMATSGPVFYIALGVIALVATVFLRGKKAPNGKYQR
jgi:hypothetical protein